MADQPHLPWTTGPSGKGARLCGWCHRDIYAPALPCSVKPVEGLLRMETQPGFGARCQYELSTRRPDVIAEADTAIGAATLPLARGTRRDVGGTAYRE